MVVDQADDELLARATLTVHENGHIEWRDTRGKLQGIPYRLAARDEVLRCGVTVDALTQKVQLPFTPLQEPLAAVEFLETRAHCLVQTLDLVSDSGGAKVDANAVEFGAPVLCVTPDGDALLVAPSHAGRLTEIDLPAHARAHETARISDQRPADR